MKITIPRQKDFKKFYELAAAEGWRVPQIERKLFEGIWARYARALILNGQFCGLVTFVPHHKSAWIGNLLVPAYLRGKGYGGHLFSTAQQELKRSGTTSIWLTASALGQPIYEKAGFSVVAQIDRWTLPAGSTCPNPEITAQKQVLLQADNSAWQEDRCSFLALVAESGKVFAVDGEVALLQKGTDLQTIGPWYARAESSCDRLLKKLLCSVDPNLELIIDLFSESPLRPHLIEAGFAFSGSNQLMAKGDYETVNLGEMVALASLGSIG